MRNYYAVNDILARREDFTSLPAVGFSLDAIVEKHAQNSGRPKLSRGANAWRPTTAATEEEGTARLVRRELNKIAPEKYDCLVEGFYNERFFTDTSLPIVIDLIFKKALEEPGYSEIYAKLCLDMARHEAKQNSAIKAKSDSTTYVARTQEVKRPHSRFRSALLTHVQTEFESDNLVNMDDEAKKEEFMELLTKRKKANSRFIGQLYLKTLLSFKSCVREIRKILRYDTPISEAKPVLPEPLDIEVVCELLECIGPKIDSEKDPVDPIYERLLLLQNHKGNSGTYSYPPRLRFRIMDLLEMRDNNWEKRVTRANAQSPTTLKEQEAFQMQKEHGSFRSPASSKLRKKGSFPAVPQRNNKSFVSPTSTGSYISSFAAPGKGFGSSVNSPSTETNKQKDNAINETPKERLARLVKEMKQDWCNESTDEPLSDWEHRLNSSEFATKEELHQEVIFYVAHDACVVTTKDAQLIASLFLVRALQLKYDELFIGLGKVLADKIELGLDEDVPKFDERYIKVVEMIAGSTPDELYIHTSKIMSEAFEQADKTQVEPLELVQSLSATWKKLPLPKITFELATIKAIIENGTCPLLTAYLIKDLLDLNYTEPYVLSEWVISVSSDDKYSKHIAEMENLQLLSE